MENFSDFQDIFWASFKKYFVTFFTKFWVKIYSIVYLFQQNKNSASPHVRIQSFNCMNGTEWCWMNGAVWINCACEPSLSTAWTVPNCNEVVSFIRELLYSREWMMYFTFWKWSTSYTELHTKHSFNRGPFTMLAIYFFRYIEYIDIFLSIYRT